MNHTLTTKLSEDRYQFLQEITKKQWITKRKVLEDALEFYEKKVLENKIKNWFESKDKADELDFWSDNEIENLWKIYFSKDFINK